MVCHCYHFRAERKQLPQTYSASFVPKAGLDLTVFQFLDNALTTTHTVSLDLIFLEIGILSHTLQKSGQHIPQSLLIGPEDYAEEGLHLKDLEDTKLPSICWQYQMGGGNIFLFLLFASPKYMEHRTKVSYGCKQNSQSRHLSLSSRVKFLI